MIPAYAQELLKKLAGWLIPIVAGLILTARWLSKLPLVQEQVNFQFNPDVKDFLGWYVAVYGVALLLFDRYFWHTRIGRLMGWKVPDLRGTWKGSVTPTALPPNLPAGAAVTGRPIPSYVVVRQSAFTLTLTLYTGESCSESVAVDFARIGDQSKLIYSYLNTPQAQHLHRSQVHSGTTILDMTSTQPQRLTGMYFTSRLTRGDMVLEEHCRHEAHDLRDAQGLMYAVRPIAGR